MNKEKTTSGKRERLCGRSHLQRVERMFREGSVVSWAERYVHDCKENDSASGRFPNLAGLGRDLGVGLEQLCRMGEKYPKVYDAVLAVLEDGALNADYIPGKSALLTMNYFRRRLGYEQRPTKNAEPSGGVRVVFDHDMSEDGA